VCQASWMPRLSGDDAGIAFRRGTSLDACALGAGSSAGSGKRSSLFALIEEFTGECLAIRVACRIDNIGVVEMLADACWSKASGNTFVRTLARR
jgi:hypothetical protein